MEPRRGRPKKHELVVSPAQRAELERMARQSRRARSVAFRARIVLECAGEASNAAVAAKLRTTGFTVGLWRNRFIAEGVTGGAFIPSPKNSVRLQNMCSVCGNEIRNGIEQCRFCAVEVSAQRLTRVASEGRVVSHTATAEAKRSKTQLANHATLQEWSASDQPSWLTATFYAEKMQPLVADLSSSVIVRHLSVSRGYAAEIRRGRVPHPRHWQTLARLMGLSE